MFLEKMILRNIKILVRKCLSGKQFSRLKVSFIKTILNESIFQINITRVMFDPKTLKNKNIFFSNFGHTNRPTIFIFILIMTNRPTLLHWLLIYYRLKWKRRKNLWEIFPISFTISHATPLIKIIFLTQFVNLYHHNRIMTYHYSTLNITNFKVERAIRWYKIEHYKDL